MTVAQPDDLLADAAAHAASIRRDRLGALLHSRTFVIGVAIVMFWIACALFGSRVVPYDPTTPDIMGALLPPSSDRQRRSPPPHCATKTACACAAPC